MALAAFPPGTMVGRFQVRQEVGRGAAGVVLRAYDPQLEREVALKLLAPERLADAQSRARFQREAVAASRLKHPHLAAIYELGELNGQPFLVMEWVEGQSLQALLKERGTLPLPEALTLVRQLADGLDYAHANQVVHRDVKTANIMVGSDGRATLVDFGLATVASAPSMTQTGTVLGTPLYMAPEQIRGEVADSRADLYSLALVFYEMLAGEPPFQAESIWAGFHRKLNEPPPRLSESLPSMDSSLDGVLARAMADQPHDRFPDGRSFVEALQRPMLPPPVAPQTPTPGRRPLLALVVLALLLGAGLAVRPLAPAGQPVSATSTPPSSETPVGAGAQLWTRECPSLEGMVAGAGLLALATEAGQIRILDSQNGQERWQVLLAEASACAPVLIGQPPRLVVADESQVRGFDLETGQALWSIEEEQPTGLCAGNDGNLYVAANQQLVAYDAAGSEMGRRPLPGSGRLMAPVFYRDVVYVAGEQLGILALEVESEQVAWKAPLRQPLALAVEESASLLVVATEQALHALSVTRGTEVWKVALPSLPVGLATDRALVVVVCQDGQVLALGSEGRKRWQVRPEPELEVAPVCAQGSVFVAGRLALHRLEPATGREVAAIATPEAWLPPLLMSDRLYLAAQGQVAAYPIK